MNDPLADADVLLAVANPNATIAALAHEVMRSRGIPLPLRITAISVPTAADATDYGPTGWSRHDDEHDGTTWYVRVPVELHTDAPAAAVPPPVAGMQHELVRDETIADVVCALTGMDDHDDRAWDVDHITIRAAARVVEIVRKKWDPGSGMWVTVSTETTHTPLDAAEVDRALHAWAARERHNSHRDPLVVQLRQSAVEIVETPELFDAGVTL